MENQQIEQDNEQKSETTIEGNVNKKKRGRCRAPDNLRLTKEQKRILVKKKNEQYSNIKYLVKKLNDMTDRGVSTYAGRPVTEEYLRNLLIPNYKSRPIHPNLAYALYELFDRDPELDFLREMGKNSYLPIGKKKPEPEKPKTPEFNDMARAREHSYNLLYSTAERLVKEKYNKQDYPGKEKILGILESIINGEQELPIPIKHNS